MFDHKNIFETEIGKSVYKRICDTVTKRAMHAHLSNGVCIGFSGGADSVLLLCFLKKYFTENGLSGLLAVHVNHMIRGDEADRDEAFSRELCAHLGIEFLAERIDVPAIARESSLGLEEAARNVRYSLFADIIDGRKNISTIAVAHNATDNAETVIFNIMRGSGTRGASGISPIRGSIVRPLIDISKADIIATLEAASVPYVTDSTNLSTDYTRNHIRHNILPHLRTVASDTEAMFTRLSENLRCDADFIDACADEFISASKGDITAAALSSLHPALLCRVLNMMVRNAGGSGCEHVHIAKIGELLHLSDFKVSLPSGLEFIAAGGKCTVRKRSPEEKPMYFSRELEYGVNSVDGISTVIIVSREPFCGELYETSSKVYKISIHRSIDSAIIDGVLSVRQKQDGDAYRYGGMTHKLKKVFNDKNIPLAEKALVPVICDFSGILWVPFLPIRDSSKEKSGVKIYIAFAEPQGSQLPRLYIGTNQHTADKKASDGKY